MLQGGDSIFPEFLLPGPNLKSCPLVRPFTRTSQGIVHGIAEVLLLTHGLESPGNTGFHRVKQVSLLEDFVDTLTSYFVNC